MNPDTEYIESPELDLEVEIGVEARVILFNDEIHSFDEVIEQIMKATACAYAHAEDLTAEVHFSGRACVFEGKVNECLKVSSVLEEIALHTQIEY